MITVILTLQTMGRAGYNYDYNYIHTADHGEGWVYLWLQIYSHCRPWGGLGIFMITIILTLQTMGRAGYNYDYNYTHTADHGETKEEGRCHDSQAEVHDVPLGAHLTPELVYQRAHHALHDGELCTESGQAKSSQVSCAQSQVKPRQIKPAVHKDRTAKNTSHKLTDCQSDSYALSLTRRA